MVFTEKAFGTVVPGEAFLSNWHIEVIAWHLEKCYRGEIKRLIINVPPRSLKSIEASVAFPAWVFGRDPCAKIITVSYGQELAAKHARDTRTIMKSSWYKRAFPDTKLDPKKNTETEMWTTQRGMRLATSVGGPLTGLGGNYIIIDDPIKADAASSEVERNRANRFYDEVLSTRLNNKKDDVIIIVMQRLHVDDLVGHVLDMEDWVVLDIPAIATEERTYEIGPDRFHTCEIDELLQEAREDRRVLEATRKRLGSIAFEAQYQQNPQPPGGNLIKREWLQTYDQARPLSEYDVIVQSWDTASTAGERSDYSVCISFGIVNDTADILDVVRVQLDYPRLRRRVLAEHERFDADIVLIEDASSGVQLGQDLRFEGELQPVRLKPRGDKITRLETHSAKIESGYVCLPERAPWLDAFTSELLVFPNGRYDDQVDALTQFLGWFSRHRRGVRVRKQREEGVRPEPQRKPGVRRIRSSTTGRTACPTMRYPMKRFFDAMSAIALGDCLFPRGRRRFHCDRRTV